MRGHCFVSDQDLPIRMCGIPGQLRIWSILSGNALSPTKRKFGCAPGKSGKKMTDRRGGMWSSGCKPDGNFAKLKILQKNPRRVRIFSLEQPSEARIGSLGRV